MRPSRASTDREFRRKRSSSGSLRHLRLGKNGPHSYCVEAEVEDVALLGWAAAQDHAHLRGSALVCNPTFALSRALGGADADLITDAGQLIELKSTSTTRTCSGKDLWQLCGYALADTHDEYSITNVGISALRWRTHIAWGLAELLHALAGRDIDLGCTRCRFAAAAARGPRDNARRR